jgi:hypothetical protein
VIGHDFGPGRTLVELGEMTEPPVWSADGQSILAVSRRPQSRNREIELTRVVVDSGFSMRVLPLVSLVPDNAAANRMLTLDPDNRGSVPMHRVSIGFDRDQEQCIFSIDISGQVPVLGIGNTQRPMIYKRFHPLDITLRMGSLAVTPDGQLVAVRIDTPGKLAPPLFCDPSSEMVKLVSPDVSTRREWLMTLAQTARVLLRGALPQPMMDGQRVERATLLPIPGEIAEHSPFINRLRRIGRVGGALLEQPLGEQNTLAGYDATVDDSQDEFRLLFDYLREDYAAAEADLEVLESRATSADVRHCILSLRAQILQAQGQSHRARPIADYLVRVQGAPSRRVEETPVGPVFSQINDPASLWPRYLSQFLAGKAGSPRSPQDLIPGVEAEGSDHRFLNDIDGLDWRGIDGVVPPMRRRQGREGFDPRPMGGPFGPDRLPRFFPPPAPPRPVGPVPPLLPRFRRPDRPGVNRYR